MVLTLVGSPFSTCTKRVATVLHEKQIPFAFKPIDFAKAEHKAPEFVKYQPFGQVPYILDHRTTMVSSSTKVGPSADISKPNTHLKELH
ncbi:hypothetical protein ONZ45_g17323 [Pleurotus djamor]|nr:hypothetical protein ONZ45_g17323 [Pleurotus djamor]